jgi:hypothetical protein
MTTDANTLGPAETIVQALLTHSDHMVHNRPGIVFDDARQTLGVRWIPVTQNVENGKVIVYKLEKQGARSTRVKLGTLLIDGRVQSNGTIVGQYRAAGVFPEVATWLYSQVAEVWKLDNEFAARWASFAFAEEHRDLKVVLAAFMLVQSRKGDPVVEGGKALFCDEDFRNVGEAMILLRRKDKKDLNPKLLLRVREILSVDGVAKINRDLGFGRSTRNAFYGRWPKAVEKWLRYREENPRMLEGLVKAGFRTTVMELARRVGYKPLTPKFFEVLRWKQKQAEDGRRVLAIGTAVTKAESWDGLSESEICEKITSEKPNWKRVVGLLPREVGVTRAIVAAAMEARALSDKDIVILTPTLEDLGLLDVQDVRDRWTLAVKAAEDMRAVNIARNVRSQTVKEELQEAADTAMKKAVAEVTKDIEVYVFVDISASMQGAIEAAKGYVSKFLQGFNLEQLHVATFNTQGRTVEIKHASSAGVTNAFRGIRAGGGTSHGAGIRALQSVTPKDGADVLFFFVGDEEERGTFTKEVRESGLAPMAFGFVKTTASTGAASGRYRQGYDYSAVRGTAAELGVPCFMVEEDTFEDPYAIPRTIRNLVASTPVGQNYSGRQTPKRVSLVETILKTDLLVKPAWA